MALRESSGDDESPDSSLSEQIPNPLVSERGCEDEGSPTREDHRCHRPLVKLSPIP